ncbi:MAG: tetratricopeptide repeat protein [Crocinitomicaceae bacterium]|nr:tetratricopeptide repeat protein [Crocinitomicaceae bacterium]
MRKYHLILFLCVSWALAPKLLCAQNFADKQFYLIDSLDLEKLSEFDRDLIDTTLIKYHATDNDTVKLDHILFIVDRCWNPEVWPKYNRLMIHTAKQKLTYERNPVVRDRLIFFIAGGISNIGFYYDEKGDLLKALDHYHRGLKLYESIENKEGISTNYNNLGVIYSIIGDTTKALEFHHKSLKLKKEINDLEGIAMSYNNIGTIYESNHEPFKALEYFEASLKIRKELNDIRGIAMSYDNIGDIYFSEKVYGKAYQYYLKGYNLWKDVDIAVGLTTSLNNLASVLIQLKNYSEAERYGLESMRIAEELGFPMDIRNAAFTLINIYRLKGDYKTALSYADTYIELQDRVKSTENAKSIMKKTMQYEYQKLALKDSLQHAKEKEVQEVKIKEKETQNYALFGGMAVLFVALLIGVRSYQRKKRDNKKINEQKREVESQKAEIEKQHIALAATHKEISDSISYAKRIQEAILPSSDTLNKFLKKGFVFYEPKDVVSGDFYWLVQKGDNTLVAAADCTGHGVPGAMVSVVCHNALNRAVREFDITEPARILDKTREIVIETFAETQRNVKDGMDISLCSWNIKTNELQWAGANNPLYIIRKNNPEVVEITLPDKQPIGTFEKASSFTNHHLQIHSGDKFFLFTDGYMDQFGGPDGKKFKYSRFRELLLKHYKENPDTLGEIIRNEFFTWKGDLEQLDDICVIGVEV